MVRERIEGLIRRVEAGETVGALEEYYAEHAIQRENQSPPREGRKHLIVHEKMMLRRVKDFRAKVLSYVVDGDSAVLRYVIQGKTRAGEFRMEELAIQRWENDHIVEETFFYDPAQQIPAAS